MKLLPEACCESFRVNSVPASEPARRLHMFPSVNGIELVTSVKLLGVWIQDNLRADMHVYYMLSLCSQRVFVMKRLRDQVLSMKYLCNVFRHRMHEMQPIVTDNRGVCLSVSRSVTRLISASLCKNG